MDCLDRTNTAQFAVGKCALAFQLHALGREYKVIKQYLPYTYILCNPSLAKIAQSILN